MYLPCGVFLSVSTLGTLTMKPHNKLLKKNTCQNYNVTILTGAILNTGKDKTAHAAFQATGAFCAPSTKLQDINCKMP